MNKIEATQKGYVFTGAYSHNKEEMKERAKAERAKGNKACVVEVPSSKYSRGYRGMGYSVYYIESEANKAAREAKTRAIKIHQLQNELQKARAEVVRINALLKELKADNEGTAINEDEAITVEEAYAESTL